MNEMYTSYPGGSWDLFNGMCAVPRRHFCKLFTTTLYSRVKHQNVGGKPQREFAVSCCIKGRSTVDFEVMLLSLTAIREAQQ